MPFDFDKIARSYDSLNRLMTAGLDILWRRRAVRAAIDTARPLQVLDVAAGTGDMALSVLRRSKPGTRLTAIDLSEEMLAIARRKLRGRTAEFLIADAERLPFPDGSFDLVTVAFGVRNFAHLQQGLDEMRRVLRPGGRFVMLELSAPNNPLLLALYKLYACRIIPSVCGLLSRNRKAYQYLPASILRFPKPARLTPMLRAAGFEAVAHRAFTFGVCRMYVCS